MAGMIKWGVIGSGGIAKRRTIPEGISKAGNAELSIVFDIDEQVNAEVAEKFGAPKPGSTFCARSRSV
jgi:predicted dehydrogenase